MHLQYASPSLHMQIKSDHEDQMPWCFFLTCKRHQCTELHVVEGENKTEECSSVSLKSRRKTSQNQIKTTSSWPGCWMHSLRIIMGSSEFSVSVDKASLQALREQQRDSHGFRFYCETRPKGHFTHNCNFIRAININLFVFLKVVFPIEW